MAKYKIIDYVYPTTGELARLILQYKDVEYDDEKVDSPDRIYEAEEDSPFGVLPILLVDGKVVAQQNGIPRYLARELDLVGRNNEEAAICDMVMDGLGVMFSKVRGNQISKLDAKQQIALFKQMIEEDVPRFLAKYERFLEKSDLKSGYLASEQLTWCDLGVALTFAGMQIRQPKLLEKYPRLKHFVDKVTANDVVSLFIETELAPCSRKVIDGAMKAHFGAKRLHPVPPRMNAAPLHPMIPFYASQA
ncbi:putative glutathione S-transferase 7 [Araneus ventricosus]|uniref:glutathione transferase n=1 Tax=Araneus ventricosus TaxID=182803 RepID=A0A4Y2BHN3_ARAVE|nr:putative glutathione S-transferase 7 [Araneus ventricosus]